MGPHDRHPRLKLLLDEHIAPRVADALQRRGIDAIALARWRDGAMLGAGDAEILAATETDGRALVTYDVRTIPPLLRRMAETGVTHAGVIFVNVRAFPSGDTRRLVRALADLAGERLRDAVLFLTGPERT